MKPFEELSRLGKIRRMRLLARMALDAHGLSDIRFKFLKQAGNILFHVVEINPSPIAKADLYRQGHYMLRIHQPGYQTTEGIELELTWLDAMCRDANLPVPEPIPTPDGKWLVQVSSPGIPQEYNCSLLRWVKGREFKKDYQPRHFRAQGQLMAQMHNHSAHWKPPPGVSKRKYDWDGLFRDDLEQGISAGEAWSFLPPEYARPYEIVAGKVKQVMDKWGKGPEVYGLIHADLGLDANILFWGDEARAIDFDDSGFGYYIYDLSLALDHCQDDDALPTFREALLDGYAQFRPLSEDQIKHLDLFLAAFWVYLSLWAASMAHIHPKYGKELHERMERAFRLVKRHIAKY